MTDGGPAFPQLGRCDHDSFDDIRGVAVREERLLTNGGMSLRDYFAAKALCGVMSNLSEMRDDVRSDVARFAADCYRMADAMLAERAKVR